MELYRYFEGTLPILISVPHAGTHVPDSIFTRLTPDAQRLPDTDWHVDRLYSFAHEMGAHLLAATHSRYVTDLNRAPDDTTLYPGQFTTGVCPVQMFSTQNVYRDDAPDAVEIKTRIATYWQPYHDKLQAILKELRAQSAKVILFEAHSIPSQAPALFEGTLPDLNFGTAGGKSADAALTDALVAIGRKSSYSTVVNKRFQGGYITRHYGVPAQGIHAVQLELTQLNYMDERYPFTYDEAKATQLQGTLREVISAMTQWVLK